MEHAKVAKNRTFQAIRIDYNYLETMFMSVSKHHTNKSLHADGNQEPGLGTKSSSSTWGPQRLQYYVCLSVCLSACIYAYIYIV